MIYHGIYVAGIGTESVLGGGRYHPVKMREGQENVYPFIFGQSGPYLSQNYKQINFSTKFLRELIL